MPAFLADENVSALLIERLRAEGLDVVAAAEIASGGTDRTLLEIAENDNRVLITEDRDFGELVIRQRLPAAGVLLLELDRLSVEQEAERATAIVLAETDRLEGHLVVIEPSRIRIRPLQS